MTQINQDQITKAVNQALTKGQAESSIPAKKTLISDESKSLRSKVFLRFLSEYGNLWSNKFVGEDGEKLLKMAKHEWAVQLTPYSEGHVMAALTKWISENKYPPKVSELIEIIKADKPIEYFARLPRPKASDEVRAKCLKEMRGKL